MWRKTYWQKQSKYNATRAEYDGRMYHSKKEANYAADLDLMKRGKTILEWEPQVKYHLYGKNGGHICTHIVDFLVTLPNDIQEVHEVKSSITMTDVWRIKRALFEDNYPDTLYRVIL